MSQKKSFNERCRCKYCGRFISYKDIKLENVSFHFIPDSDVSSEQAWWYHKKCKDGK